MNRRALLAAALALGAGGCASPGIQLDAPYVSTPYEVIEEMLRLAALRSDDLLYDLGCGDGRIVIEAARRYGARGVGVDIDPARIAEANAAAARAGVSGRVRFLVQDFFKTDLSEATVVALYLFSELNARLKPKFQAELRPGARIVSHEFGIGDWAPAKTTQVEIQGSPKFVHLWIMPPR